MTKPEVGRFNELLGAELGRRPDGHPIFAWKNSDDLFWPLFSTGRRVLTKSTIEVPVVGTNTVELLEIETESPEYKRDRQVKLRDTWVMTKWLSPEDLIFGTDRPHGLARGDFEAINSRQSPTHETLARIWNERFPGADFPSKGWRIPVNVIDDTGQHHFCSLPARPDGPREPNAEDTRWFVACIREQTRLGFAERLQEQYDGHAVIEAAKNSQIEAEIRDSFPAFLSPSPGKRNNFVSFPWTKRDRL